MGAEETVPGGGVGVDSQVGALLGISLLIVLFDSAGSDMMSAFDDGWLLMAGFALMAGATVFFFLRGVAPQTLPAARREAQISTGD